MNMLFKHLSPSVPGSMLVLALSNKIPYSVSMQLRMCHASQTATSCDYAFQRSNDIENVLQIW